MAKAKLLLRVPTPIKLERLQTLLGTIESEHLDEVVVRQIGGDLLVEDTHEGTDASADE